MLRLLLRREPLRRCVRLPVPLLLLLAEGPHALQVLRRGYPQLLRARQPGRPCTVQGGRKCGRQGRRYHGACCRRHSTAAGRCWPATTRHLPAALVTPHKSPNTALAPLLAAVVTAAGVHRSAHMRRLWGAVRGSSNAGLVPPKQTTGREAAR